MSSVYGLTQQQQSQRNKLVLEKAKFFSMTDSKKDWSGLNVSQTLSCHFTDPILKGTNIKILNA